MRDVTDQMRAIKGGCECPSPPDGIYSDDCSLDEHREWAIEILGRARRDKQQRLWRMSGWAAFWDWRAILFGIGLGIVSTVAFGPGPTMLAGGAMLVFGGILLLVVWRR